MDFEWDIRPPRHGITTIGYLDDDDNNELFTKILEGISIAARHKGIHLVRFGYSTDYHSKPDEVNNLFSLIEKADLDGLIFLGWTPAASNQNKEKFLTRFHGLPLISIGSKHSDVPSVMVNGTDHIRLIVEHLIKKHHYRNIAYIPHFRPDDRPETWKKAMVENGLWHPDLEIDRFELSSTDYEDRARRFLDILMNERKVKLDAIVSCGVYDTEALMKELHKRHLRVPEDIALTGYSDSDFEQYSNPGITTIDYPWSDMGYQACITMIQLLETGSIPMLTIVPGREIYRESCGCTSDIILQSVAGPVKSIGKTMSEMTISEHEAILATLNKEYPFPNLNFSKLLDLLTEDLSSCNHHSFLEELTEQLNKCPINVWHSQIETLIYRFRSILMPWLITSPLQIESAENLFHNAQKLLFKKISTGRGFVNIYAKNIGQSMQETVQAIMTKHTYSDILTSLMDSLPKLDIPACHIIISRQKNAYNDLIHNNNIDSATNSELNHNVHMQREYLFAINETVRIHAKHQEMESLINTPLKDLFHHLFIDEGPGKIYQVHPIMNSGQWFGCAIFEAGPVDEEMYRALSMHLGAAFKTADMVSHMDVNYQKLADQAYQEGMSDVVSQVLHHIGNVFNSINASVQVLSEEVLKSPIQDLLKAEAMLLELVEDNAISMNAATAWSSTDPLNHRPIDHKLPKLLSFFRLLGLQGKNHHETVFMHLSRIEDKIHWIDDIITIQQTYVTGAKLAEPTHLLQIIEDALKVHSALFENKGISVSKAWHSSPKVMLHRSKFFHTMVFIIGSICKALSIDDAGKANLWLEVSESKNTCDIQIWGYGRDLHLVAPETDSFDENENSNFWIQEIEACRKNMEDMKVTLSMKYDDELSKLMCELHLLTYDNELENMI